jgi:hypothetical protein
MLIVAVPIRRRGSWREKQAKTVEWLPMRSVRTSETAEQLARADSFGFINESQAIHVSNSNRVFDERPCRGRRDGAAPSRG